MEKTRGYKTDFRLKRRIEIPVVTKDYGQSTKARHGSKAETWRNSEGERAPWIIHNLWESVSERYASLQPYCILKKNKKKEWDFNYVLFNSSMQLREGRGIYRTSGHLFYNVRSI